MSIKIINDDCMKVLKNVKRSSIDLVVADPPYFLDGFNNEWKRGKNMESLALKNMGNMKFDPQQGKDLQKFITKVGKRLIRVLKPGSFCLVFSQSRLSYRVAMGLDETGFEIRDILVWRFIKGPQYKAIGMGHFINQLDLSDTKKKKLKRKLYNRKTPQLRPLYESIILAQKPRKGKFIENWINYKTGLIDSSSKLDGKVPSTVIHFEKEKKASYNIHPTVKPVLLIEHLINVFSAPNQTVLDPFLGSGTTAIAALRAGRKCIGIEINENYINIVNKRIKEYNSRVFK